MKDLLRFVKSSGIYFVGTVLTKLISFLLLPLYTSYISPGDYGTYDLHNAYVMFFCSVLYLDIWAGIMRFMYDYTGEDRKKPISSGIVIFTGSSVLYSVLLISMVSILKLNYPFLLFLYGILMNMQTLVGYIARGYGKNILYTAAGLAGSVVTILFNILLLVYVRMDYSALFIASCIGFIVNIVIIVIGVREPHVFSVRYFDKKVFKELFMFSLPLCLNSVAYWFLTSYNRVAVSETLGTEANGYYAIAGRFGSMITLFTTCFQMAWQELAYSKSAKEDNLGGFYSVAINSYIKCMGTGLIILIPVIFIVYPIMINESYSSGKELVPVYLLGTILSSISSFLGNTFSAIKKNNLLFWTMLIGSVINVASIHILLPLLGLHASNVALFLGFTGLCSIRMLLLKRQINLRIDYWNIVVLGITFTGVTLVYIRLGMVANVVTVVVSCAIACYIFRDIIVQVYNRIKAR